MAQKEKKILVIGHKNPDTDSICSAIAYAGLKNRLLERYSDKKADTYMPVRCGHVSQETQFVLNHFKVKPPKYITDVSPQVLDIEIRRIPGISEDISLNTAYRIMKEQECVTLPVINEDNSLIGVITINDIAESDMDMFDNHIIGKSNTPIKNILSTIDGKLLCGDPQACISTGKTTIAASSRDIMDDYIQKDDLVITGNRPDAHRAAIRNGACCVVICGPNRISKEIIDYAVQKHVTVIETAHDTYTTARLINHSMPVKSFMAHEGLLTFKLTDSVEHAKEVMTKHRVRDYPVLDTEGHYVGMISRRNLLGLKKKRIILVDHNELDQAVDGADDADILEVIDHHRLGALETAQPVFFRCQPLGCTATIVYRMYKEEGIEIDPVTAGLLCSAIISDTLMFRSPTCTPMDLDAADELASLSGIKIESFAKDMFKAGSDLKDKSAEDIFFQDFKKFNVGEVSFGAGQINSMTEEDFPEIIAKLKPFMEKELTELRVDSLYFLLTGILSESSEVICIGKDAMKNVEEAFGVSGTDDEVIRLPGIVSRKKQFIPPMAMLLQQR